MPETVSLQALYKPAYRVAPKVRKGGSQPRRGNSLAFPLSKRKSNREFSNKHPKASGETSREQSDITASLLLLFSSSPSSKKNSSDSVYWQ